MIRDWTVLVYMSANNNLGLGLKGCLKHQLGDLEPSDRVTIAVESSHLRVPHWTHPDSVVHTRSEVGHHQLENVEKLPYANMGDGATLVDFLQWGIQKYPAKNYMVVLQGHTSAWTGGLSDDVSRVDAAGQPAPTRDSLPPWGDGNFSAHLTAPQMRRVFDQVRDETGVTPSLLAFDSCLSGSLELLRELDGAADWIVASEDRMYSPSRSAESSLDYAAPLKSIFQKLSDRVDSGQEVSADQCAADWVEASSTSWTTPTMSAFRAPEARQLTRKLDDMATRLLDASPQVLSKVLERTRNFSEGHSDRNYDLDAHLYDLGDLLAQIEAEPDLSIAHQAVRESRAALEAYRPHHQAQNQIHTVYRWSFAEEDHGLRDYPSDRTSGLTVWLPDNPTVLEFQKKLGRDYQELAFADGPWSKLIDHLTSRG